MRIVPGVPARIEVGFEQQQAGLDPEHVQRGETERQHAVAVHRIPERVPDVQRIRGVDPDLVPEVAAVAGPADGHPCPADLALRDPEVRDVLHLRHELLEEFAAARALEGEGAEVVADLLDPHVVATDPVLEVGEVRLRAGQQELVLAGPEDHAVLDHEAAIVEPARVLGVAGLAGTDVAGEDAGEEASPRPCRGSGTCTAGSSRRCRRRCGPRNTRACRHLVAVGREMPGPVAPELGLVEGAGALVERCARIIRAGPRACVLG